MQQQQTLRHLAQLSGHCASLLASEVDALNSRLCSSPACLAALTRLLQYDPLAPPKCAPQRQPSNPSPSGPGAPLHPPPQHPQPSATSWAVSNTLPLSCRRQSLATGVPAAPRAFSQHPCSGRPGSQLDRRPPAAPLSGTRLFSTSVAVLDASSQQTSERQPLAPHSDSPAKPPPLDTRKADADAERRKPGAPGTRQPEAAASDAVYNLPNAVSAARLVSGPVIGFWLLQGHYEVAAIALAISGASDWLDGFLARRMGASSVFGSYLDPLADKVLIGCVAAALLARGDMPVWLAVVVVGRDVLLVSGAFAFRLRGFGWRWPGREAFFRTADEAAALQYQQQQQQQQQRPLDPTTGGSAEAAGAEGGTAAGTAAGTASPPGSSGGGSKGGEGGVAFMRPLLVSKANTVLQLVLLGGYLTRGMYGWPAGDAVAALEVATAATTVLSLAAYGTKAVRGELFK